MTKPRFRLSVDWIIDTKTCEVYTQRDIIEIHRLLNELDEENLFLKGKVANYKLMLLHLKETAKRLSEIR